MKVKKVYLFYVIIFICIKKSSPHHEDIETIE